MKIPPEIPKHENDQTPEESVEAAESSPPPGGSQSPDASAETLRTGIWEWHLQENELILDEQVQAVLGGNPADADALFDLIDSDDRQEVRQSLTDTLETEQDFRERFRLSGNDRGRSVEAVGRLITGAHGEPERVMGTMRTLSRLERSHPDPSIRVTGDQTAESVFNFKRAVEYSGHGIFITDPDGTITYVNPAFEKMSGYNQSELEGNTPRILNSGIHDKEFFRDLWETIASGEVWRGEIISRNKSGELFHTQQTIAPVQNDNGELTSFISIQEDITEKKEREQELLEKNRAIENSPIGIVMSDATKEDNPLCYVNDGFEQLTGYDKQEILGENCRFLQGEETDPDVVDQIGRAIYNEQHVNVEMRNYRADGEMFWNQLVISPMRNDEGEVTRFVGYQQDVTERKKSQQKLQLFRETMNKSPEEIFILDPDTAKILDATDPTLKKLGYTRDELLDMSVQDINPEFGDELSWPDLARELKQDGPVTLESLHSRRDGSTFPIEVHADHVVVDGHPRIVAIARDITQRVEQRRKIKRQAELLTRINDRMPGNSFQFRRESEGSYALTFMSKGFEQISGVSSRRAMEDFDNVIDRVHPEDRDQFLESIERSARSMNPWKCEWRFVHSDGQETWVRGSSIQDQKPDGSVIWTGVVIDVSEEKEQYRQLKLQKQRFQTLFDNAPIGLWEEDWSDVKSLLDQLPCSNPDEVAAHLETHPETVREIAGAVNVLLPNDTLVDMTGASNKQQLIDHFEDLLTEDTYTSFRDEMIGLLQGETSCSSTMSIRTFNGETRHMLRDFQLVPGHESDWSRVFVSYRDITDRIDMQRSLRASEQKFRQLAENIEEVFWMTDPEKQEMIYISPAYEEIWGRSRQHLYEYPEDWLENIHPEDRERIKSLLPEAQIEGDYDEQYRIIRPGGDVRWVHDRAYPVTDEEGNLQRITGIAEDITEQKEMENSLRRSEERYRTLFEEANEAFLIESFDDKVLDANKAACEMLGYSREELAGMALKKITPSEIKDQCGEKGIVEYHMDRHGTSLYNWDYKHKDTSNIPIEKSKTPIVYDGTDAVLICARDRSELEQIRKESERKSSFVSRVTHDLRTPLNSILGMGQLLMETDLSPEQHEQLRVMLNATRTMERLTDDILDLDRIEQGKITLEETTFNLSNLLGQVLSLYSEKIRARNLIISSQIEDDVPEQLVGDPDRLKQILHNLVDNAVEHTEEGTIRVTVEVKEERDKNLLLGFSVSDTGKGIPHEKQSSIFNRGEQLQDDNTSEDEGLGLGLSICSYFVALMNGEIRVDSKVGEGSTFAFTAEFEEGKTQQDMSLEDRSILIVDDNQHVLNVFASYLESHGMTVVKCTSGEQARKQLQRTNKSGKSPFDAVFLDHRLKDVSGLDLLDEVESSPDGINTERIYIISGDSKEQLSEKIKRISIAGVIEKPISESRMISAVQSVLKHTGNQIKEETDPILVILRKRSRVPLHVLLVEDNAETENVMKRFLEPISEDVTTVSSGVDALEKYKQRTPDLVLMDIELIGSMDGLETILQIRSYEREQELEPVPIITQTALAMEHVKQRSLDAGANAFIRKPLKRQKLYRTIRDVLKATAGERGKQK